MSVMREAILQNRLLMKKLELFSSIDWEYSIKTDRLKAKIL